MENKTYRKVVKKIEILPLIGLALPLYEIIKWVL
jgi:hypothetical protein